MASPYTRQIVQLLTRAVWNSLSRDLQTATVREALDAEAEKVAAGALQHLEGVAQRSEPAPPSKTRSYRRRSERED